MEPGTAGTGSEEASRSAGDRPIIVSAEGSASIHESPSATTSWLLLRESSRSRDPALSAVLVTMAMTAVSLHRPVEAMKTEREKNNNKVSPNGSFFSSENNQKENPPPLSRLIGPHT